MSLGAILFSILFFDRHTVFPGFSALLPCLGTAGLIWIGTRTDSIFYRILSLKALVFVGLISYSLYLWHWPILVFRRLISYGLPKPIVGDWITWLIMFGVAVASWRFVEKPFRHQGATRPGQRRKTFVTFAVASISLIIFNLVILKKNGLASRFDEASLFALSGKMAFSPNRKQCHQNDNYRLSYEDSCVYNETETPAKFLLWGDSHGVELADAISKNIDAADGGLRAITYSSCPPVIGYKSRASLGCEAHNRQTLKKIIEDQSIRLVVLIASYSSYASTSRNFLDFFKMTIDQLLAADKKVIVISPVPRAPWPVLEAYARSIKRTGSDYLKFPLDFHLKKSGDLTDQIKTWSLQIEIFDPAEILCDSETCLAAENGEPLYFNSHHLSIFGARKIAEVLIQDIKK